MIVCPLRRPSMIASARTVLAGKGSLRRAKNRRALAGCAPFRRSIIATGGSGGNTISAIRLKTQRARMIRTSGNGVNKAILQNLTDTTGLRGDKHHYFDFNVVPLTT